MYKLLDSGDFKKLESIGGNIFVRPAPQAFWQRDPNQQKWQNPDFEFIRSQEGKGHWVFAKNNTDPWVEKWWTPYRDIEVKLKRTSFGHLGFFAEHFDSIDKMSMLIEQETKHRTNDSSIPSEPLKVLSLFAYTGIASIQLAKAGAKVTHVDASGPTIDWASENTKKNFNGENPIRWMVDDAAAFVKREARRGKKYDAIVFDPPSFGRGPKGQLWKIEQDIQSLLESLSEILSEDFLFVFFSSHTPGFTPQSLKNLSQQFFAKGLESQYQYTAYEMLIPSQGTPKPLSSGACCWVSPKKYDLLGKPQ